MEANGTLHHAFKITGLRGVMMMLHPVMSKQKRTWLLIGYGVAVAVLLCAPLFLSDFRLNLLAKFLAYAIVAIGLI